MWEDPIVAEVHRTREKLAAQYNFDIGAFFADVRRRQVALGGRLVPQKKQAESTAEPERGSPKSSSSEAAPAA
jgi:hypothetical protein